MLRIASLAVLVICSFGPTGFAADPANALSVLEKKLHGRWQGQGPCDGTLILHANGSYERKQFGPAGEDLRGTWKLHWNALPPTLALNEADPPDGVMAETKWRVRKLSDQDLILQFVRNPETEDANPGVYRRNADRP